MVGEAFPTIHGGPDFVDDGGGLGPGHAGLLRQAKDVRSSRVLAFPEESHAVLAAGAGGVQEVVGGRKSPIAARIVHEEGEIFNVVVPVVGRYVKHHPPQGPQYVLVIARQNRYDLEEVGVIRRGDAKIRLDEVAERVDMKPPVAVAIKPLDAEETPFGCLE